MLRPLARPFLSAQIRSCCSTLFWHDDWSNLGPLIDVIGPNGPRVFGIRTLAIVSDVCTEISWRVSTKRHPSLALLKVCLPPDLPSFLTIEHGFYLWRNSVGSPPSVFSTSKTWKALQPFILKVDWFNSVWFKSRIPKHDFILWLVMRDRLSTRDRLITWGLSIPSDCLLCNSASESKAHIFFNCSYSAEGWNSFFTHLALSPPVFFDDIVRWVHRSSRNQKLKTICKLIFQGVVYFLWKEMNTRLHSSSSKPTQLLVKEI